MFFSVGVLPIEVGARCGLILSEAGVGFCMKKRRQM